MTNTATTTTNRDQALSGLAARAERYGWTVVVGSFDSAFNLTFFRELPTGQRELLLTRLSATGRITKAERRLWTNTRLDARDVFTHDKLTSVQLAMSA